MDESQRPRVGVDGRVGEASVLERVLESVSERTPSQPFLPKTRRDLSTTLRLTLTKEDNPRPVVYCPRSLGDARDGPGIHVGEVGLPEVTRRPLKRLTSQEVG